MRPFSKDTAAHLEASSPEARPRSHMQPGRTPLPGLLTYPPLCCGDGFHCEAVESRPTNGLTSLEPLQILSCTLGSFWEQD